jgi:hypothetical protein
MIGIVLASLAAIGLLVLGVGAIVAPRPSAAGYGLQTDDPVALALIRALGIRDIVLGLIVAAMLYLDAIEALKVTVGLLVFVALGDAIVVLTSGGRKQSLAVHVTGIVGLGVIWLLLHLGR